MSVCRYVITWTSLPLFNKMPRVYHMLKARPGMAKVACWSPKKNLCSPLWTSLHTDQTSNIPHQVTQSGRFYLHTSWALTPMTAAMPSQHRLCPRPPPSSYSSSHILLWAMTVPPTLSVYLAQLRTELFRKTGKGKWSLLNEQRLFHSFAQKSPITF